MRDYCGVNPTAEPLERQTTIGNREGPIHNGPLMFSVRCVVACPWEAGGPSSTLAGVEMERDGVLLQLRLLYQYIP